MYGAAAAARIVVFDLPGILPERPLILVVRLSSMGDVIHVTPCLRALRDAMPEAAITLAVESRWSALVKRNPHRRAGRGVPGDAPARG